MKDIIKTYIKDPKISLPLLIWLFLAGMLHFYLSSNPSFSEPTKPSLSNMLLEISLLAVLLVFALCYLIFALNKKLKAKPNKKDYWYFQDPGLYVDPTTKEIFCNKCFTDGFLSQVSLHPEKGLICRKCDNWYCDLQEYPRLINKIINFKT